MGRLTNVSLSVREPAVAVTLSTKSSQSLAYVWIAFKTSEWITVG